MPTYKVKPETFGVEVAKPSKDSEKHYPTVYFPVSKEILAALEVGQDVVVTLKGKVQMLESRQDNSVSRQECRIELREVEAYAKGEYEKLAEDDNEED